MGRSGVRIGVVYKVALKNGGAYRIFSFASSSY
jgi:hypothetical protein